MDINKPLPKCWKCGFKCIVRNGKIYCWYCKSFRGSKGE